MIKPLLLMLAIGLCLSACASGGDSLLPQSRYLLLNAGYRLPLNSARVINSGHSIYLEAGLNLSRFFKSRPVIGLFGGFSAQDRLWSTAFSPGFVKDYREAIDPRAALPAADSAIVARSAELFGSQRGKAPLMPGCSTGSFHNYSLYYGLVLELPQAWLPALKLYTGSTRSHFQGDPVSPGQSYSIVQLRRRMYGAELMLRGSKVYKGRAQGWLRPIGRSVYYEHYDMYTASLYGDNGEQQRHIRLRTFASHAFLRRYQNDYACGLKLFYTL